MIWMFSCLFIFISSLCLLQIVNEELRNLPEEVIAGVPSVNAMIAVRVHIHLEIFVSLDKSFGIFKNVLGMHVVVGEAMAQ